MSKKQPPCRRAHDFAPRVGAVDRREDASHDSILERLNHKIFSCCGRWFQPHASLQSIGYYNNRKNRLSLFVLRLQLEALDGPAKVRYTLMSDSSSEEETEFVGEDDSAAIEEETNRANGGSKDSGPLDKKRSSSRKVSYKETDDDAEDDEDEEHEVNDNQDEEQADDNDNDADSDGDDDDNDDSDDSDDDVPLSSLAPKKKPAAAASSKKKKPAATNGSSSSKKRKATAASSKKPPATKKKKGAAASSSTANGTTSNGTTSTNNKSYEYASAALYGTECDKGLLIQRLLCRWWYAYTWPTQVPDQAPAGYDPLEGFPGVYVGTAAGSAHVGQILDQRDAAAAPSFRNFCAKSVDELRELLMKALTEQMKHLDETDTVTRKQVTDMLKWAKAINAAKAEKEATKILKAHSLYES
jgi:hypothetical protein